MANAAAIWGVPYGTSKTRALPGPELNGAVSEYIDPSRQNQGAQDDKKKSMTKRNLGVLRKWCQGPFSQQVAENHHPWLRSANFIEFGYFTSHADLILR